MSSEVINTRMQDSEENPSRFELFLNYLTISLSCNSKRRFAT